MKSIFGRINTNNQLTTKEFVNKSLDNLSFGLSVKKDVAVSKNYGFGEVSYNQERNKLPDVYSSLDYIVLADCRLDNKNELHEKLELKNTSVSDAQLILESYKKWGNDCPKYLLGDFAFVIYSIKNQELFCARDHFGVKSFYYYCDNDKFIFSSEIAGILGQNDLKISVDEQYIADSISIIKSEKYRTTYKEIKKLPPAHYLILNDKEIKISQYWELTHQNQVFEKDEDNIRKFKELLIESVKCRLDPNQNTGAELSGGIDSSTVTAIALKFGKISTFSHILPDNKLGKIHPFNDERDFINILADYCKISNRNFITSEKTGSIHAIQNNIELYKGLTQQSFHVFSDCLYEKAQQAGISVLLSGFGGDEVVTSKASAYLKELISNGLWNELKIDLKNQNLSKIQYYKSLIKYFLKLQFPFVFKILTKIKKGKPWWYGKFENLAVNEDYSKKMKIKERYFSFFEKPEFNSTQDRCIERITHPHVSQRLEYCAQAAKKYGVEYRYPLLDKRLIEFYLSMPIRLKARNGIGRYAIRKAIEGIVPKEIQWRNDKSGATIPTVLIRTLKDKDKILEIINQAKTNTRIKKYIDPEKYENWYYKIINRSKNKDKFINPGAFYNYLKLILFIDTNPGLFDE